MTANTPDLNAAIAAAVQAPAAPAEGTVAPAPEAPAPQAAQQGSEGEVVTEGSAAPPADGAQAPEATEENTPTDYFGVDLSALPAAERAALIEQYKERDRTANIAQREAAELRKAQEAQTQPQPVPPPADEGPVQFDDVTLAQALELNLEDEDDAHVAKTALPLARALLEVRAEVDSLKSGFTTQTEAQRWQSAVEALQAEHGPLPVDFTTFVENAAQRGISDPTAAYWAEVGPARAAIQADLNKRLIELRTEGKRGATTPRPRSSEAVVEAPVQGTNTLDATEKAIRAAAAKLGVDVK